MTFEPYFSLKEHLLVNMKRHPTLIPLSRFHRSILFLALIAKKNAPPVKGYPTSLPGKIDYAKSFYDQKLKGHFQWEDEKLFSFIKGRNEQLDQLASEMLKEREELKRLFAALDDNSDTEATLHDLGIALEKHIRKEEREFFQMIQEVFTDQELDQLGL